jgi:hypothetical protein
MPPRRAGYLLAASVLAVASAIPAEPHYFTQLVDHFSGGRMDTFSQRFYENSTWFKGPGSPILMIVSQIAVREVVHAHPLSHIV